MASRLRPLAVVLIATGALITGSLTARAQVPTVPTLPEESTTTTTTTAPSSTTTTTAPAVVPPGDGGGGGGGGDDQGGGDGGQGGQPPPEPAPAPAEPSYDAGDGVGEPAGREVPPELQALIDGVARSRANNTARLLDALAPLRDLGLSEEAAAVMGMGRFPVAGYASFVDDWWFPRWVPELHLHEGTDIFAEAGTPVRASFDGIMRQVEGPIGGLAVYIDLPDGGYVYMSHLSAFAPDLVSGQPVRTGQVVGYVGDSGNAKGGKPHLHFELHIPPEPVAAGTPVPPVNPKPHLDAWIEDAVAAAPGVIAAYQASRPRALLTTGLTRRLADGSGTFAAPSGPPRAQLLWASSANPSGGALALAEARAAALSRRLDAKARR